MQIKYCNLNVYPLLILGGGDFGVVTTVAPCNPVEFHRNFEREYYLHLID
jgi:hypothetical protein